MITIEVKENPTFTPVTISLTFGTELELKAFHDFLTFSVPSNIGLWIKDAEVRTANVRTLQNNLCQGLKSINR